MIESMERSSIIYESGVQICYGLKDERLSTILEYGCLPFSFK